MAKGSHRKKGSSSARKANPFSKIVQKKRHNVLNRRVKGGEQRTQAARSQKISKRKRSLLVEFQRESTNSQNSFVDKRFTSNFANAVSEEDAQLKRFQRERRAHISNKRSRFHLDDNVDRSANKRQKLDDAESSDSDSDADDLLTKRAKDAKRQKLNPASDDADAEPKDDSHTGGFRRFGAHVNNAPSQVHADRLAMIESGDGGEGGGSSGGPLTRADAPQFDMDRPKTEKEKFHEIITKSRFHRAIDQNERLQHQDEVAKLNAAFDESVFQKLDLQDTRLERLQQEKRILARGAEEREAREKEAEDHARKGKGEDAASDNAKEDGDEEEDAASDEESGDDNDSLDDEVAKLRAELLGGDDKDENSESKNDSSKSSVNDDFTSLVNQLQAEASTARASNRTPTDSELAEAKFKRKQQAEKERLLRQQGLDPSKADPNAKNKKKAPRRMTDDDLCDDFDFDLSDQNNASDDDGEGSDDGYSSGLDEFLSLEKRGPRKPPPKSADDDDSDGPSDSEDDSDAAAETGGGPPAEGQLLMSDDEMFGAGDALDDVSSGDEGDDDDEEEKKFLEMQKSLREKKKLADDVMKTFPRTGEEFLLRVRDVDSVNELKEALVKFEKNVAEAPPVHKKSKERQPKQVFLAALVEGFEMLADDAMPSQQKSKREKLSVVADAVVRVALKMPSVIAAIVRQRLTDIQASLADGGTFTSGNLMLFRLVCLIFPTSDLRHSITTPLMLLLCQHLSSQAHKLRLLSSKSSSIDGDDSKSSQFSPLSSSSSSSPSDVLGGKSLASSLFVCSLALNFVRASKRYLPELVAYLRALIRAGFGLSQSDSSSSSVSLWQDMRLNKREAATVQAEDPKLALSTLFAAEASPEFSTKSFRLQTLAMTFSLLQRTVAIYEDLPCLAEVFGPLAEDLARLAHVSMPRQLNAQRVELLSALRDAVSVSMCRSHLVRTKVPKKIRQFTPKFDEDFVPGQQKNSEVKRLKKTLKQDTKAALRELRQDTAFLQRERHKQQKAQVEDRQISQKAVRRFMQTQFASNRKNLLAAGSGGGGASGADQKERKKSRKNRR